MVSLRSFKRSARFAWACFVMLVLVAASACAGGEPAQEQPAPAGAPVFRVVTVTNILADWARAVGGGRVEVESLVPTDGDPHNFQPRPPRRGQGHRS